MKSTHYSVLFVMKSTHYSVFVMKGNLKVIEICDKSKALPSLFNAHGVLRFFYNFYMFGASLFSVMSSTASSKGWMENNVTRNKFLFCPILIEFSNNGGQK